MIGNIENPLDLRSLAVLHMDLGLRSHKKSERLSTPSKPLPTSVRGDSCGSEPLAFLEKAYGPDHPEVAKMLHKLAFLYHGQEKYTDAEPLYKRSLAVAEKAFGSQSRMVASVLNNLGRLYYDQKKYGDAETLYLRSLAILETDIGPSHPKVLKRVRNLANLHRTLGRGDKAAQLETRCREVSRK